jgi:hypothetical protein
MNARLLTSARKHRHEVPAADGLLERDAMRSLLPRWSATRLCDAEATQAAA